MVENQSQTKRVESSLVRCLDGGSSPPISTIQIVYQSVRGFTNTFTNTFCKLGFVKPLLCLLNFIGSGGKVCALA